ncbi:MAG: hypothetical protein ACP5RH_15740 [Leptodesmis sp.]
MTLAMSQEIDFLVMLRVFRRFVSQPGLTERIFGLLLFGTPGRFAEKVM